MNKKPELELDREKFEFEARFHWLIFTGGLLLASVIGFYTVGDKIAKIVLSIFIYFMVLAMILQFFNVKGQLRKVRNLYKKLIEGSNMNKTINNQATISEKRSFWFSVMASLFAVSIITAAEVLSKIFSLNEIWTRVVIIIIIAVFINWISYKYILNKQ